MIYSLEHFQHEVFLDYIAQHPKNSLTPNGRREFLIKLATNIYMEQYLTSKQIMKKLVKAWEDYEQ